MNTQTQTNTVTLIFAPTEDLNQDVWDLIEILKGNVRKNMPCADDFERKHLLSVDFPTKESAEFFRNMLQTYIPPKQEMSVEDWVTQFSDWVLRVLKRTEC